MFWCPSGPPSGGCKELLKVKELHTQKYTLIRKISQLNITYYSYIYSSSDMSSVTIIWLKMFVSFKESLLKITVVLRLRSLQCK